METAGVEDLKARLDEYLKKVEAGEEVVITEHGRPIARLSPPPEPQMTPEEEQAELEELYRLGIARPPLRDKLPDDFWTGPRFQDPEGYILRALLEERGEGR